MEERAFSDISHNKFLNEEKLMGVKCKKCGAVFAPARPICPKCKEWDMEWMPMKGTGKLIAYTCIAVGPPMMIQEGYDREHPYCSGVVELDEGPKVCARIEGVDASRPETIKVGTPVTVEFLHRGEGENLRTFLAFKPMDR